MHETFWTLLHDAAHWEFELFLMLLFDGVIFGICWPFLRKHWKHHIARDQEWVGTTFVRPDPYDDIVSDEAWPEKHEACGFTKAPLGWICTRDIGHDGPCANRRWFGKTPQKP